MRRVLRGSVKGHKMQITVELKENFFHHPRTTEVTEAVPRVAEVTEAVP